MRLDREEPTDDVINLTPLIDVVFLLLVFFLVATTFADDEVEMDLELPEARNAEGQADEHLIVINIAEDGTIKVDGRPVTAAALEQKLLAAAERNKDQEVLIRGDTRVELGRVVNAFDACLAASLRHVSIAANPIDR